MQSLWDLVFGTAAPAPPPTTTFVNTTRHRVVLVDPKTRAAVLTLDACPKGTQARVVKTVSYEPKWTMANGRQIYEKVSGKEVHGLPPVQENVVVIVTRAVFEVQNKHWLTWTNYRSDIHYMRPIGLQTDDATTESDDEDDNYNSDDDDSDDDGGPVAELCGVPWQGK
jgi:hypothetical protein